MGTQARMLTANLKLNRGIAQVAAALFFAVLAFAAVLNYQVQTNLAMRHGGMYSWFPLLAQNSHGVDLFLRVVLSTYAGVGAVFLIELIAVGWAGSSLRALLRPQSKSPWYDMAIYGLIQAGYFNLLVTWISLGLPLLAVLFWDSVGLFVLPSSSRFSTGILASDLAIFYFVFTFFDYWNHRIFHFSRLWKLHRLHHSAKEFTVLTAARNHPVAMAIEPFIRNWPIALIGLSPQGLAIFTFVTTPYFHVIHSRLDWSFGWFGRWILISPRGHRIHHSDMAEHQDKNLSICPLWDRIFGTWYGGPNVNSSIGLIGEDYPTNNILKEWFFDLRALVSPNGR